MYKMEITPSEITFAIGIIGTIFAVYKYFKNPQIEIEKKDALLEQQVQNNSEIAEKRFKDIQDNFNGLLLQSNNHIHTVDTKVDFLTKTVNDMGKDIIKLSTIIEERIPRK